MMMLSKKAFFTALALAVVAVVIVANIFLTDNNIADNKSIVEEPKSFIDCLNIGGDIEFSDPMTCTTDSGKTFTQEIKKVPEPEPEVVKDLPVVEEVVPGADCAKHSVEKCPSSCVVCPPCLACSSLSCQSEEYCSNMGIDRSWYEDIKTGRAEMDSSTPIESNASSSIATSTNDGI